MHAISRHFVHKHSDAEVLLTDAEVLRPDVAHFGIKVDRSHSSNADDSDTVPLIAGLEIMRQLGLAVGHLSAQVPLDWAFTLQDAAFEWRDEPHRFTATEPFIARARVTIHDVVERKGHVSRLRASADLCSEGRLVASGSGDFRCLPPETYRLLRRRAIDGASAEDRAEQPQIITETLHADHSLTGVLGWPRTDAFLFDHATDHVPGMLLAKAGVIAHQILRSSREPIGIRIRCDRFAEITRDVTIAATSDFNQVTTQFEQGTELVGRVVVSDRE